MTLQTPFSCHASWNNAEAFQALVLGLQVLPLMLPACQKRQMFKLGSTYVVPCTLCSLDIQGFDYTFLTRKVVALHPAPLHCQTLPTLNECSKVLKVQAGNLSRGVGPVWHDPLPPLSSDSTGCTPEVGAHGPEPRTHHIHPHPDGKV